MLGWIRRRRRAELLATPTPAAWREIVRDGFPLAARLTPEEQEELLRIARVLVAEKRWEGVSGQEVDDRVRVLIAAQAALLLLRLDHDYYPRLRSVLVYPTTYRAPVRDLDATGVASEGLAWDAVVRGAAHEDDARNVVFHEFAHQLDAEQPRSDGAPRLRAREDYREWARVLGEEYATLRADLEALRPVHIDPYGATNAAEFFAVLTEAFFERPRPLRRRHPELYAQLARFYGQDPAAR